MNTHFLRTVIISVTLSVATYSLCASETSNIIIDSSTDVYRIFPDKSGNRMGKVKHKSQTVYRTLRTADKAVAMMYYNDDISIDKTTGGNTSYGSYFSDDIFYSDSKACLMTIPIKEAGAMAKSTMERTYNDPDMFCTVLLPDHYPSNNLTVKFIIPASLADIRVEAVNLDMSTVTHTIEENDKERVITYFIPYIPAIRHVSRAPSINETAPQLRILGQYRDVDDLYHRLYRYATHSVDPNPDSVIALAREITADCTSDSARIAVINDYVHDNIRYKAIEHGEYGYIPDSPSEVLRKRFGDCKGSAGLLRAMLRGVGIDARYVWVGTENILTDWTDAPYLASGNHMIAAAVTGDSLLYLDGTARYFGIGDIPTPIHGRQTIVEDTPEKCIIGRIPSGTADHNRDCTTIHLSMLPDLSLSGNYSESLTGEYNAALRTAIDNISPDKLNDALSSAMAKWRKGAKVKDAAESRANKMTSLTGSITIPGACQSTGDELYVDINPYPSLRQLTFDTKERDAAPGRLSLKSTCEWKICFDIPEGYVPGAIPKDMVISNDWIYAAITTTVSDDDTLITRHLKLTVKQRDIPAADIDSFNHDIKELAGNASALVSLKRTAKTQTP